MLGAMAVPLIERIREAVRDGLVVYGRRTEVSALDAGGIEGAREATDA